MKWKCPECGRMEYGPIVDHHYCGGCKTEMAPIVEQTTEANGKKETVLKKLQD